MKSRNDGRPNGDRERTLPALFDGADDDGTEFASASVTVDLDLRVIDADPTFCSLVGYDRDRVVGSPVGVFLRDEDLSARVNPASGETGGPLLVETQCERPNGELVWMHLGVTLLDDVKGGVLRRMDVLEYGDERRLGHGDERRRVHAVREQQEEGIRRLVDDAPDVVYRFRFSPTPSFEYVSRAAGAVLGHRPEEYYAHPDLVVRTTHPDDLAAARQVFTTPSFPGIVTFRTIRPDGSVVWLEHRVVREFDGDGTVIAIEAIARDVTERHRALEEARRRSLELELLKDVAVAANQAADVKEALRITVDRVCETIGWPVGHAYLVTDGGRRLVPTGIWHVDDERKFATFVRATEQTTIPVGWGLTGEVAATGRAVSSTDISHDPTFERGRAGEPLGVRAAMACPLLIGPEVVGVLEFFSDDDRAIDDEMLNVMLHVGTELGRVVERSRAETDRSRLDQSKTEFIVNAAHELRNPVGALAQLTTLLSSNWQDLTEQQLQWAFESLGSQGRWLSHLASQLLDLSQIEQGKAHVDRKVFSLEPLVERVLRTMPPPEKHRVMVEVPGNAVVTADPLRVEQILVNLVQNAYRYGGPHVKVSALRLRESVELTVSDDGPGLASELAERAFEPFTRGAGVDSEGSGLGLAVVQRLARLLGGDVRYDKLMPTGCRFVVRLPGR